MSMAILFVAIGALFANIGCIILNSRVKELENSVVDLRYSLLRALKIIGKMDK